MNMKTLTTKFILLYFYPSNIHTETNKSHFYASGNPKLKTTLRDNIKKMNQVGKCCTSVESVSAVGDH